MQYDIPFYHREMIRLLMVTMTGVLLAVTFAKPVVIGFLPGLLYLILLCWKKGVSSNDIVSIGMRGLLKTKEVIIILLFVSMLLPAWYLSGTIEEMVSLSLHFLSKEHFLLLSFVFMMVLSMLLGTAVGSLSALGIPIMSAAATMNVPLEAVAGALVSGAFVGDRTSPFSSAFQLLAHTVEVPVNRQFRKMMPTTVLAVLFSVLLYFYFDMKWNYDIPAEPSAQAVHWSGISFITLVPPIILLFMAFLRIKIKYAFLFSILAAVVIAVTKGTSITTILFYVWMGTDHLGGGISKMILLLLFIALAGVYNGLLEELKIIQPFLDKWLSRSTSLIKNTWKTVAATFIISVIACNQTLPIILTGRSFLGHWQKHYGNEELSRIMADSTMLFPGMIPWSILAMMCSIITGVPMIAYLPYAIFLWVLPIITITFSFAYQVASSTNASKALKSDIIKN
jgi:Na+:H+ antiporter, NhaC family